MTLDRWIKIYNADQEVKKVKEEQGILKTVRPEHDITFEDTEVSSGAPWISKRIITEFEGANFLKITDVNADMGNIKTPRVFLFCPKKCLNDLNR